MTAVFERILEMSGMAAVVIAVVLLIRLCLRKAPRKYSYALWSVAAFRLVCPVSFQAFFSLFRLTKQLEEIPAVQPTPVVSPAPVVSPGYFDSGPVPTGNMGSYIDPDLFTDYPIVTPPVTETPAAEPINWMQIAAIVWLIGLAALLIYGIVSYLRLRRRMDTAVLAGENVWHSDRVQSPFILGFLRPKIYLPFGLTADQQGYVLAHERYHLKRFDHIVRPLSFLILAVHWFNPLVWLAYYLMSRDMEMSCDEKVLSAGDNIRRAYSTTLLSFAANRRFPSPSPLAFGESGVKGRIKNALNWKRPRTWVTVIAIVVCIVVILVCAANPKEPESLESQDTPYGWAAQISPESVDKAELYIPESEPQRRALTQPEVAELLAQLKLVDRSDFSKTPENGTWAFPTERMITLSYDGVDYVLNLGPGPMTISCKDDRVDWQGETHWYVDSYALKDFIRQLPGQDSAAPTEPDDGYYQSVENIYLTPVISAPATADSGYYYMLQGDELRLINKHSGAAYSHTADGNWQELSEEVLHKMEWGTVTIGETDLWDTLRERQPMIRLYGNDSGGSNGRFLLNFGDELWVGGYGYGSNGYIHIASVYRLKQLDDAFSLSIESVEQLAVRQADLTHDGLDETITVSRRVDEYGVVYYGLDIRTANGKSVWSVELNSWEKGGNGYYLYERDGEYYLLEWFPHAQQSWYNFAYKIYRLSQTEEPEIIEEDSLVYDLGPNYREKMLTVDTEPLRAFEKKINALLQDAQELLVVGEGSVTVGDPDKPVWHAWRSPAADWEQEKLWSYDWFLSVRTADLTHDGVDEIITLTHDEDVALYILTVTNAAGETLWRGEAHIVHAGEAGFYLYQRNGKHYLMQWNPYGSTGGFYYHYEVFSLTEDGGIVPLVSNTMEFVVINEQDLLELDIGALRAFEQEVNELLKDTVLLVSTYGGNPRYSTETEPICQLWDAMGGNNWEQRQQHAMLAEVMRSAGMDVVFELIDSVEEIDPDVGGTSRGVFVYRVQYRLAYNEDARICYVLMDQVWEDPDAGQTEQHTLLGILSEAELQQYNREEILKQYDNDLYRAAAMETYRKYYGI